MMPGLNTALGLYDAYEGASNLWKDGEQRWNQLPSSFKQFTNGVFNGNMSDIMAGSYPALSLAGDVGKIFAPALAHQVNQGYRMMGYGFKTPNTPLLKTVLGNTASTAVINGMNTAKTSVINGMNTAKTAVTDTFDAANTAVNNAARRVSNAATNMAEHPGEVVDAVEGIVKGNGGVKGLLRGQKNDVATEVTNKFEQNATRHGTDRVMNFDKSMESSDLYETNNGNMFDKHSSGLPIYITDGGSPRDMRFELFKGFYKGTPVKDTVLTYHTPSSTQLHFEHPPYTNGQKIFLNRMVNETPDFTYVGELSPEFGYRYRPFGEVLSSAYRNRGLGGFFDALSSDLKTAGRTESGTFFPYSYKSFESVLS